MIQFKQKFAYTLLGGLLVFALQFSSINIVDNAAAQGGKESTEMPMIKYIFSIDYPLGKKGEYLQWIKSIADILQAPEELQSISSYDNYYGGSPHRFIEFEFANMMAATTKPPLSGHRLPIRLLASAATVEMFDPKFMIPPRGIQPVHP